MFITNSFKTSVTLFLFNCFFKVCSSSPEGSSSANSSSSTHRFNRKTSEFIKEWNEVNQVLEACNGKYKAGQQVMTASDDTNMFVKTRPYETGVRSHSGKLKLKLFFQAKSSVLIYVPNLGTRYTYGGKLFHQVKEKYMYKVVFPTLYQSWLYETLSPNFYYSTKSSILIVENLRESGFYTTEGPLHDLTKCMTVIKSLAQFHALSIHHYKQMESSKIIFYMNFLTVSSVAGVLAKEEFFIALLRKFRKHVTPSLPEEMRKEFEHTINNLYNILEHAYVINADGLRVIVHGDLNWTNTFFRNNDRGRPVHCKFMDFQSSRFGSPMIDLVNYLITSVHVKVRKFAKTIFTSYSNELKETLKELKYDDPDIYNISSIRRDVRKYKSYFIFRLFFVIPQHWTRFSKISTDEKDDVYDKLFASQTYILFYKTWLEFLEIF